MNSNEKRHRHIIRRIHKAEFEPVGPCVFEDTDSLPVRWWWATYRFFRWHARYWHCDISHGVINMCRWLPIIWRDRNYDHGYLNEMILKKMRYMQKGIRVLSKEGKHHKALDRCVVLMDELIKRDKCDCHKLGNGCDAQVAIKCGEECEAMRYEFGKLFAKYSPHWWD